MVQQMPCSLSLQNLRLQQMLVQQPVAIAIGTSEATFVPVLKENGKVYFRIDGTMCNMIFIAITLKELTRISYGSRKKMRYIRDRVKGHHKKIKETKIKT